MNKQNLFITALLILSVGIAGCSTSNRAKNPPDLTNEYISLTTDSLKIDIQTPHFSKELNSQLALDADSIGKHVLSSIVDGYSNSYTKRVTVTEDPQQAGMHINISKIVIKRGWFTFDVTHPGPLYRVKIKLDTGIKGKSYYIARGKSFENMAINTTEPSTIKWLSGEQKDDRDIQLRTAHAGIREALGEAMADIFQLKNYYK